MNKLMPMAIVIDRPTYLRFDRDRLKDIEDLGGAWSDMVRSWAYMKGAYIIMVAHTDERIRQRAPLTWLVVNDAGLKVALRGACSNLCNINCKWALFIERGSVGEQIITAELLNDSKPQGTA